MTSLRPRRKNNVRSTTKDEESPNTGHFWMNLLATKNEYRGRNFSKARITQKISKKRLCFFLSFYVPHLEYTFVVSRKIVVRSVSFSSTNKRIPTFQYRFSCWKYLFFILFLCSASCCLRFHFSGHQPFMWYYDKSCYDAHFNVWNWSFENLTS